jgi:phage terminase large subunit
MPEDLLSLDTIRKYTQQIEELRSGLDHEVIAYWAKVIEADAVELSPDELKQTIQVIQDDLLPMKLNFKASKRAVPFLVQAIEKNLDKMPLATRLYFQKVEDAIWDEYQRYIKLGERKQDS